MRRFLLAVVFSCACVLAQAQEHLLFIGIPIQGSIDNFIELLKDKGFKKTSSPYSFDGMEVKSVRGTFWNFPIALSVFVHLTILTTFLQCIFILKAIICLKMN